MVNKLQKIRWDLYKFKKKVLMLWGFYHGLVIPYDDELIEKLRDVYYGSLPASIILLSNSLTNGNCYDQALLMSRAFLESDGDVSLFYAIIDGLKLNPEYISNGTISFDHSFVERVTKNGKRLIIDTSSGFIFDKELYWLIENPNVRRINSKETIIEYLKRANDSESNDIYGSYLLLPLIEKTFNNPLEMYAKQGIELLQREIEHYKKSIGYDTICEKVSQDMKRLRLIN